MIEPKIGREQMQASRVTLGDVARRAGVSKATASRVLSGSRDRVSEDLARRVASAAEELDYVPNPHARALARAASPSVALIVHDVSDPYFAEIAGGALRVAADHERLVVICTTFRDPEREAAYVSEMRAQRAHAVLVAGSSSAEVGSRLATELEAYHREGGRVALMTAGQGYPAAVPDNLEGGRQAALHLIGQGHRRLGVVAGPAHLGAVQERLRGFESVVAEAGLEAPEVVHSDFTRDGGAAAARRLLGRHAGITAVLAQNDLMAIGVLRHASAVGRAVPGDLSVMGFDDIPLAADLQPGLSTIRVPMEEIGAAAMRLALTADDTDSLEVFSTALVVRDTTAPPAPT